jgi:cytochrome P450
MQGRQAPRLPGGNFVAGHAISIRSDEIGFYLRCEREHAPIVQTRIVHVPFFVVTEPAIVEEVLVKKSRSFMKPVVVRSLKLAFGDGLLTSEADKYRMHRKIIQQAFAPDRLAKHAAIVSDCVSRMLSRWRDDEVRNVHRDLVDLCLEIVSQSLFGESPDQAREIISRAASAVQGFTAGHRRLWYAPMPLYWPTPATLRYRRAISRFDAYVYDLLARRRRELQRGSDEPDSDLISLLMKARDERGAPLSVKQIRDEVVTMFLAGHETAAAALSWALYLVAADPSTMEALREEVDEASWPSPIEAHALGRLARVEQVIDETFRLYPPVYRIGRTAIEDCEIGGYHVPKGSEVVMPQCAIHRSARFYDAPDTFRPTRWTREFRQSLPRYAFFPFSGGVRSCVGSNFVMVEDLVILAAMVQEFRFDRVPGPAIAPFPGFTLLPENANLLLRVRRRERLGASIPARDPSPRRSSRVRGPSPAPSVHQSPRSVGTGGRARR